MRGKLFKLSCALLALACLFLGLATLGPLTPLSAQNYGGSQNAIRLRGRMLSSCSPLNGQIYIWNSSTNQWICGTLSTLNGGVLAVTSGGTGTGTAFTQGSAIFAGASGVYSQDNANFFWDGTNHRLGIGTASPSATLHVIGGGTAVMLSDGTKPFTGNIGTGIMSGSVRDLYWTTTGASGGYAWYVQNGSSGQVMGMGIDRNGNVGIGTTSPASRLDAPTGTVAALSFKFDGTVYSAAGTAVPTCNAGNLLLRVAVSDATLATPGSTYVGSGTYTIALQCTYNSTGPAYTWIID